jgi:hypothetical protein
MAIHEHLRRVREASAIFLENRLLRTARVHPPTLSHATLPFPSRQRESSLPTTRWALVRLGVSAPVWTVPVDEDRAATSDLAQPLLANRQRLVVRVDRTVDADCHDRSGNG